MTVSFMPFQCFFPQNLIASVRTPLFLLNTAYDSWQVNCLNFINWCGLYL